MVSGACFALAACATLAGTRARGQAAESDDPIPIERIMADPDWIGNAPESPYWAADGQSIYYRRKRAGEDARDWVQVDLSGEVLAVVPEEERHALDPRDGDLSRDWSRRVFERSGDLFLLDVGTGLVRQLTRTTVSERSPAFVMDDAAIAFQRGGATFVRDLEDGFEWQPFDLEEGETPDPLPKREKASDDGEGFLERQQERLFDVVRERRREREAREERGERARDADPTLAPRPLYVGKDVTLENAHLSPDVRWVLVELRKKGGTAGKRDRMPEFVTESGYVEDRTVRSKVGTGTPSGQALALVDLEARAVHRLELGSLPGVADDPLRELREGAAAYLEELDPPREAQATETDAEPDDAGGESAEASPDAPEPVPPGEENAAEEEPRELSISRVRWNPDGTGVVLSLLSLDNKDSWLATVDLAKHALRTLAHDHDEAWINWRGTGHGWLAGGSRLWVLSEATGYAHLSVIDVGTGERRALTEGEWEVSSVTPSRDGRHLYFLANREHPGAYDVYRVAVEDGVIERLSTLGGRNSYELSPDESKLLVRHSEVLVPPELFLQDNAPGAPALRITHTVSEEFASQPWVVPEVVAIPARHGRPVYSRVYLPPSPPPGPRPAVVFIHGAGYLQNAHKGWSDYFREFMFHSLLAHRGFVVLDMDYRASAGYGRDWRTAIYRDMGTPELEDLADGVDWIVANANVDRTRVGTYGGSYGGFLTLMALFKRPELFACGAALRPVTDWAHYNHGYTASILNIPIVDPEAYVRSSPIEFADGLQRPLLICHGMQDDNVFFQDTVRLVQRLIELEKQDFEVAIYPVEAHGFRRPSSWLDEYRRILNLFERELESP